MKLKVYHNSTLLPDRAGMAQLIYKDVPHPSRENDIITIPASNYDLYILENTSQFLLLQTGEKKKAWFGGTDENPFLVELADADYSNISLFQPLWEKHEFYDAIKPDIIKTYEKKFGVKKTMRQGDFFLYPLPEQNWDKVLLWASTFGYRDNYYDCQKGSGGLPLKETRHRFWGKICTDIVSDGLIKAPDHKPLEFKEICVLAQTKHLFNPKRAD